VGQNGKKKKKSHQKKKRAKHQGPTTKEKGGRIVQNPQVESGSPDKKGAKKFGTGQCQTKRVKKKAEGQLPQIPVIGFYWGQEIKRGVAFGVENVGK